VTEIDGPLKVCTPPCKGGEETPSPGLSSNGSSAGDFRFDPKEAKVDESGFPFWGRCWQPTASVQASEPMLTDEEKKEARMNARIRANAKAAKQAAKADKEARESPEARARRLARLAARHEWFAMGARAGRKHEALKAAVLRANLARFEPPADAAEFAVYINAAFDRI
jgi:hypothetical protein